ncbi:hypothetical protein SUGI_1096880 [Cryptomeria japonica]|nr:hypothetical protein SUGI_1096880 [Cryptomeria japonica]
MQVDIVLSNGFLVRAVVPSGVSATLKLHDGGKDYLGKGFLKAVANANTIIGPALVGMICKILNDWI